MDSSVGSVDLAVTRRTLLKGGALIVSWTLFEGGGLAWAQGPATGGGTKPVALDDVASFLAIAKDGHVIIYSGKVDLGTGVKTALSQIAADELGVPLSTVTLIQGDTLLTPDQGPTYGSLSIQIGGMQIRHAAATARKHLVGLAASRLGGEPKDLVADDGAVSTKSGGQRISFGDLMGDTPLSLKVDQKAPLKQPADYKLVGKPVAREDIPGKVTGQFSYMQDFTLPGMLHGRVVRPPAIEAQLLSVDQDSVKDVPGLVKVVRQGNFLGVVAKSEWGAITASRKLKANWSDWQGLPDESQLWSYVRGTKIVADDVTSNRGNVQKAIDEAARTLSATYEFAIHTHGSIGPSCAVAEIKDGSLTCWSASQATHTLQKQLALMLSMPAEKIRCIYLEGSGCYGRNGHEDAAADAVILAQAVGKPVRVQWMREDENGWDPKGPPTLIDIRAGLDRDGNIMGWQSAFYIPKGAAGAVPLIAAGLAGLPTDQGMSPGNIIQDSAVSYELPNVNTVCHRLETTPLRPSWIRAPGRLQNTFANESFMDELAAAANADPLEYRKRLVKDSRGLELLDRLAKLSNWETRPSPKAETSGKIARGRGLSYVKYENYRTYVGAVAEVEADRDTGEIRVPRFFVVHDCGQIINPDGVRNQVEGNVVQTLSRTLKERVTFNRSRVTSLDWATYPILTFPEMPEVIVELIDRPNEAPWGAGEPSSAVVSSAVSNAVFDAIGVRLRSVPFTPEKVKSAA
jgi:nicotinate dehydrogenase subunit B